MSDVASVWQSWWTNEVIGRQFHSIRFVHWTPFVRRQLLESDVNFEQNARHVSSLLSDFEWDNFASTGLAIVEGWEILCDSPNGAEQLGKLRSRVMEYLPPESTLIMLSTSPRPLYPETIGSRLIFDAQHILPPTRRLMALASETGSTPHLPEVLTSPNPTEQMHEMMSGLPAYVLAEIEEVVFAAGITLTEAIEGSLLSVEVLECLTSHCIIWNKDGGLAWSHGGGRADHTVRDCFEEQTTRLVKPDALALRTFESVWRAERNLRQIAKLALRAKVGKPGSSWKKQVSQKEWVANVLRKSRSSGYSHASRMVEVSNPLDWLSFDELCALLLANQGNVTGLGSPEIEAIRTDLAGVRNRVAHLRLLTNADCRVAKQWDIRIQRARERAEMALSD